MALTPRKRTELEKKTRAAFGNDFLLCVYEDEIYFDGWHLSLNTAILLRDRFSEVIQELAKKVETTK